MKNLCGVVATTLLIAACAPATPPAPATPAQVPAPKAYAPLDRVMQAIPFHNSNIIFDTQTTDPEPKEDPKAAKTKEAAGKKATTDYASVYGGWKAVENAAIGLQETANLISLPGRLCSNGKPVPTDREDYRKFVQGLADAGTAALEAAKTRNLDKMVDVSGTVSDACLACHEVYRDKEDNKDRCTPPAAAAAPAK